MHASDIEANTKTAERNRKIMARKRDKVEPKSMWAVEVYAGGQRVMSGKVSANTMRELYEEVKACFLDRTDVLFVPFEDVVWSIWHGRSDSFWTGRYIVPGEDAGQFVIKTWALLSVVPPGIGHIELAKHFMQGAKLDESDEWTMTKMA